MTKKFVSRKPIAALLSLCMLFLSFLIPFQSARAEVITHEKYEMKWAYSSFYGKDVRTELLQNANGQIAYCLTYGKKSPSGEDLPEIGRTDDVVYRVLLNGYPQKTPEQLGVSTWQQAHYATQLSIWVALGQLSPDDLQFKDAEVEQAVKTIRYAADHTGDTQDVYMNVVPSDKQEASLQGEYFETTTYTVESNAKKGTYTVELQQAPAGTRIVTEQGEAKDTFQLHETFRVQVPKSSKSAELSVKVHSNLTNYQAVVYQGTQAVQDATVLLERNQEQISQELQVFWKSLGDIEILKVDENKTPLAGAVFEVSNQDGQRMGTITTDAEGKAWMQNLEIGLYTAKELQSPVGYILNDTPQTLEVKTGETATWTAENKQIKGNVQLLKVDAEHPEKKVAGVTFQLKNSAGTVISEHTTDENGRIKVENLPFGSYTFVESKAKEGYVLSQEPIPFQITEQGQTIELEAKNAPIYGELEITKVDVADGNHKLPNAEFEIRNEKGDIVAQGKTNVEGIAKFSKIPFGTYTYREVVAPEGFMLNEETFSFEIKQNGEIVKHTVADEKIPSIQTTATDKTDGAKEMHTSQSVTIQDKVEYKDLIVGKSYTMTGKLMDKSTGKPLVVEGKEVTAEATFTPQEANGSMILDFTFDATGLEEKEVVVFEELVKEGKVVATHADIEDKGQTVKFVKPSVKTTATNKADGSKELDAMDAVTIQDKVEYKDLVVGKEYVVKGKLMDKSTNKPLLVDGKEVTAESTFTAKEKDGFVMLDFTFNASNLQGKEVVVFEDVYHNDAVVVTHADIHDKGQTVKFKKKPEQPQTPSKTPDVPVQPEQPQPKVEQPAKAQPMVKAVEVAPKKAEGILPTTGGKAENPYWVWIGGVVMLLGGFLAIRAYRVRKSSGE
ncbi:VaFE repeat-containing surface-anchored protein [Bacillus cereus]|uniref:TQXA domain-containing protein n=1 Tax=Bacillus cereus TaxID=1396 RepID=A0A9X7M0Z1_BACCE|nr:VaFE repeat-containing surface-anchored protein [Bacillus cereus]MDA2637887.1 VaFE repeat-containing surface-anchored protein [Bacillus cereus]QDZ76623.1 TQXA domain-containing protein [Bacillus cereus]